MPLRKPKAVPLPRPFTDLERSADEHARRRALLMKRELDEAGGFSWHAAQPGWRQRMKAHPPHRKWFAAAAVGMSALIVFGFAAGTSTGIKPPDFIVFFENWGGDRTAEDAIAAREERMDALRAEVAANRAALAAAEARQKALEAERAAARLATS